MNSRKKKNDENSTVLQATECTARNVESSRHSSSSCAVAAVYTVIRADSVGGQSRDRRCDQRLSR